MANYRVTTPPGTFYPATNSTPGLDPPGANTGSPIPDLFYSLPEFAKRDYLLSLADSIARQSGGVAKPMTSFLLGIAAGTGSLRRSNIPKEWERMFRESDQKLGLPAGTTERQINAESSFNPVAPNASGALGLAQIMPGTLADAERALGRKFDRTNPRDAIYLRNWDLGRKLNARDGNLVEALRDYGGFISKENRYSPAANQYVTKILGEHWIMYDHPHSARTALPQNSGGAGSASGIPF